MARPKQKLKEEESIAPVAIGFIFYFLLLVGYSMGLCFAVSRICLF